MPPDATSRPPDVDLAVEQRKIVRNALWALLFCTATLAAGVWLLPRFFEFPTGFSGALSLAIQADIFVFLWLVLGVRMVARVRFRSAADNAGSAYALPSPRIAVPLAFLQNTLEQVVIAVGAHVALATVLTGHLLALIPTAVCLFAIGRITFLIGYPKGAAGRAFGIVVTVIPSIAGYLLAIGLIISNGL